MRFIPRHAICVLVLSLIAAVGPATGLAKTLLVGPGKEFPAPSAAIAAAEPGDTVAIEPGQYFDCAVVARDRLTIEGLGDGATLTDKTCMGKALLVTMGRDIMLRNLTLTRARVPDRNGAGIRAEGDNLTIEHVKFINNEDGILAADAPLSTIIIRDSEFLDNGRCLTECAHAVYVGRIARLIVANSRFFHTLSGHHIKSRAARTEILDSDIADGPEGGASYLVDISDGGELLMRGNRLEKGPNAASSRVVVIGAESPGNPSSIQQVLGNTLVDDGAKVGSLVLNWGAANPVVSGNTFPRGVSALSREGRLLHRLHSRLYGWKAAVLSAVPAFVKHDVRLILSLVL